MSKTPEDTLIGFEPSINTSGEPVKKKAKKSGGFQSMGFSKHLIKAIYMKGYRVPTPIQRKSIPPIMQGQDVVAMARTGSGKTACFLLPLIEKLKDHDMNGIRAIILSPTRELATQTYVFLKEFSKYSTLKFTLLLGGDPLTTHFSRLSRSFDIIIGTPGRFLHLCVEMDLNLSKVKHLVLDEADRLFEMGFNVQLNEILARLPQAKQTVLFSATLPKVLVDFTNAGLNDPILIRLDVDSKIPNTLHLAFLHASEENKAAALISLLKNIVKEGTYSLVFTATKHHVEYLNELLTSVGILNTYIYSELDPAARKINLAKFLLKEVRVLIVTDVAARGIDIPKLDYVINFNFPATPKLFVHRVGRCARAGKEGWAITITSSEEISYLIDLHLFLGRPLTIAPPTGGTENESFGKIPYYLIEEAQGQINNLLGSAFDLDKRLFSSQNAMKKYYTTRSGASLESLRRSKEIDLSILGNHYLFKSIAHDDISSKAADLLKEIRSFKVDRTVFELGVKGHTKEQTAMMKEKRNTHEKKISLFKEKLQNKKLEETVAVNERKDILEGSNVSDINRTFSKVILDKKKDKRKYQARDENFVPYKSSDQVTEDGLAIVKSFQMDASKVGFDLLADSTKTMNESKVRKIWDKKKKRMVQLDLPPKSTRLKTESGYWIDASYKSGLYEKWRKERSKFEVVDHNTNEETENLKKIAFDDGPKKRWQNHMQKLALKKLKGTALQLKNVHEIARQRLKKERLKARHHKKHKKHKTSAQ